MIDPIELYESFIGQINAEMPDAWFAEQLAQYRAGDEAALRRISERCLGRVLTLAKKHWRSDSLISWLDTVQEGNAALVRAIRQSSAKTAEEFLREMTATIEQTIVLVLQHPDMNR